MDIRQDSNSLRIDLLLIVQKKTGGEKPGLPKQENNSLKKPHSSRQIISSYENQGNQVRVEIHPPNTKPQLFNRQTAKVQIISPI
ncbi:hypothetical protein GDO86_010348 [Hymenochirus boettgeri]|uniref:Uncharacterized protein n=1 Tax=Hymenochirus boettgeri TaxID=247094 RepID=A0A8T2JQ78_9PIPI|nr:hypothetical protein GDO86_010348 [Hymenochirus boettgeri]